MGENRSVSFLLIFLLGVVIGKESLSCFIQKQSGVLVGDVYLMGETIG